MTRAAVCLLLAGFAVPAAGRAAPLEGSAAVELEYWGQDYFNEIDLPSPVLVDGVVRETDTTRFAEDAWLPGQRLALRWESDLEDGVRLELGSRTGFNRERFQQDLDARARFGARGGTQWSLRGTGALREESRSFVGHGDWSVGLEAGRIDPLSGATALETRVSVEHARTRGDTTSFLYDFDRIDARVSVSGGRAWFPDWEAVLGASRKSVASEDGGSYGELTADVSWNAGRRRDTRLTLDARLRDYDAGGEVGRDFAEVTAGGERTVWSRGDHGIGVEAEMSAADYRGSDELYYDYGQLMVFAPVRFQGVTWNAEAGPRLSLQRDFEGGERDYAQWTLRTRVGRTTTGGGYAQLGLETGYRDYRGGASDVVDLAALSTTLLRSDFWLLDVMVLAEAPLGGAFFVDVLASTLWEVHPGESERILVALATLAVGRRF
jgi:hypothetical protein